MGKILESIGIIDGYDIIVIGKMMEYDKVTLDDKVIQIDPKKSKKERIWALIGGFALGFVFGWIIFYEVSWGLFYGIIFAPLFSGLEVVITNKRGRKKK